jgi:hypothetical protein
LGVTVSDQIVVQIACNGEIPYEDNLPGGILSSFSDNVLGAWTHCDRTESRGSDFFQINFSEDAKSLDLILHPGAAFNNGRAISAADIEFSILRGFSINPPFYFGFLSNVVGVSPNISHPSPGSIEGIKVIDSKTLRLTFRRPCREILHSLSLPFFSPRPKEEIIEDFIHYRGLPVGAGNYAVKWMSEQSGEYRLERVRGGGPPRILLTTRSRPEGARPPDVISGNIAERPEGFLKAKSTHDTAIFTLFSSNSHELLQIPGFREDLFRIFDRRKLINQTDFAESYGFSKHSKELKITNAETKKAQERLRSLVKNRFSGTPKFQVPVIAQTFSEEMTTALKSLSKQFHEIGIEVSFFPRRDKFLDEKEGAQCPFWLWWLVIDPVCPAAMLSSFRADSAYSFHRVSRPEIAEIFDKIDRASSDIEKEKLDRLLDHTVSKRGYGVPLFSKGNRFFYNPRTIKSLGPQSNFLSINLSSIVVNR